MWSSPDQLEALSAVVREGSFERAAVALSITTSAVSQRVKALESAAGRVLLKRERPVTATEAGRVLLKLGAQLELLERDALRELQLADSNPRSLAISVNADSLKTWLLPALVSTASQHGFTLDLRREDQDGAARLLRDGEVMAAISSDPTPIQGCSVRALGAQRYGAVASETFRAEWFAQGVTATAMATAPTVAYDRVDRLLDRFLDEHASGARPPRNFIPGSWDYARAIELGLGWGLVALPIGAGLIELAPSRHIESPLYWHQWRLPSAQLTAVSDAAADAARDALRPLRRTSGG